MADVQEASPVQSHDVAVEVKPNSKTSSVKGQNSSYKVVFCGNSWQDLIIIPLCLLGVYVLTGILFALCTRAVIQTDDTATALWMFFGLFVAAIVMLGIVLFATSYEKKMLKKHKDDDA
jgi:hypothetical protein